MTFEEIKEEEDTGATVEEVADEGKLAGCEEETEAAKPAKKQDDDELDDQEFKGDECTEIIASGRKPWEEHNEKAMAMMDPMSMVSQDVASTAATSETATEEVDTSAQPEE